MSPTSTTPSRYTLEPEPESLSGIVFDGYIVEAQITIKSMTGETLSTLPNYTDRSLRQYITELNAIKETFGDNIPKISSTKSLAGHSLGATSVHEAVYSLIMMKNNFIAASANITDMDDEAKNYPIVTKVEKGINLDSVMSNSFGFGGTNATLVFEKV